MKYLTHVFFLLFLILPSFVSEDNAYYLDLISRIFIFALFAMSLDLIMGYGKMASMGHAIFFGLGAYSIGILSYHFGEILSYNYFAMLFIGLIFNILIAYLISIISLKTSGVFFIMITLALSQLFFFLFNAIREYGGEDGLMIDNNLMLAFGIEINGSIIYYLSIIFWFLSFFILRNILNSPFGKSFIAISSNELKCSSMGFDTKKIKKIFFVLSACFAFMAGSLLSTLNMFVSPSLLHWTKSAEVLIMVVTGGMQSLVGSLFGASLFLLSEEFLAPIFEGWKLLLGIMLIIIIMSGVGGIYPFLKKMLEKLIKKL